MEMFTKCDYSSEIINIINFYYLFASNVRMQIDLQADNA